MATPQQRAKARGRETENMVVSYLVEHGFPNAERRRLKGSADEGDITGIPGVVIEVKGDRSNRITEWRRETTDEMVNARVSFGFLVVRTERQPIERWDVHVPASLLVDDDLLPWSLGESVWVRMDLKDAVTWLKETGF